MLLLLLTNKRRSREIVGPLPVVCFAPEMTTTVTCFRALPTVMVTASITFKRLLNSRVYSALLMPGRQLTMYFATFRWHEINVPCYFALWTCQLFGYKYQFEFRTICFVRKSELGTVSSLKTPNRKYRISSFRFLNVFLKNFFWSFRDLLLSITGFVQCTSVTGVEFCLVWEKAKRIIYKFRS